MTIVGKTPARQIEIVLTDAQQAVLAAASSLLWRLKVHDLDPHDLKQQAMIKVVPELKNLQRQDPAGFTAKPLEQHRTMMLKFCGRVMAHLIIDHIRRADVRRNPIVLAALPGELDDSQQRAIQAREEIWGIARSFEGKKRDVLLAIIEIGDVDMKEIAERTQISEKYAYRLLQEIRDTLA